MYVCICNAITEDQVRAQLDRGARTVAAVHRALGVSPKCGKCLPMMRDLVRRNLREDAVTAVATQAEALACEG